MAGCMMLMRHLRTNYDKDNTNLAIKLQCVQSAALHRLCCSSFMQTQHSLESQYIPRTRFLDFAQEEYCAFGPTQPLPH